MIALGSIFRNSTPYLGRYFTQAASLRQALGEQIRLLLVEGDSTDGSWDVIQHCFELGQFEGRLIKREHGGPRWGSVDAPDRWAALSWCCNGVMEAVTDETAVIYVESDLVWDANTMKALLERLREYPAVSPLCFTRAGHFYDIWGYAKDGQYFTPFPPYHPSVAEEMTRIDSAGSCIAMRGDIAREARFGPLDCVRGLGRSINQLGSLWLDPTLKVVHP